MRNDGRCYWPRDTKTTIPIRILVFVCVCVCICICIFIGMRDDGRCHRPRDTKTTIPIQLKASLLKPKTSLFFPLNYLNLTSLESSVLYTSFVASAFDTTDVRISDTCLN